MKIDHLPFTREDYELLDEILRGEDPRYGQILSHSDGAEHSEGKHNQSSPAPAGQTRVFLKKAEMVDAISGATLPQFTAKFVPGALYTTYTVWDLANTHRNMMMDYTRSKLFVPEYYDFFFAHPELNCRRPIIEKIAIGKKEENALVNTFISIVDTTKSEELIVFCLDQIQYYEVSSDTVAGTLGSLFFGESSNDLKRKVISKWNGVPMPSDFVRRLPMSLADHPELFNEILYTIQWQEYWPSGMIPDLIKQIDLLKDKGRQRAIYEVILPRRAESSTDDWKLVKAARKKYGF
jgi:hypothetical protein